MEENSPLDNTMDVQPSKQNDKRLLLTNNTGHTINAPHTGYNNGSKLGCNDTFEDCSILGQFYCSDMYKFPTSWSFQNCRQYCGWCNVDPSTLGQTSTTPRTTLKPSVPPNVCLYKGQSYKQGDIWQDDCSYNCTCNAAGIYHCRALCPTYENLPNEYCQLVQESGQCCPKLSCVSRSPFIHRPCRYNGTQYKIGDTWQTSCETSCTCIGDIGASCFGSGLVCLNWDSLPSICHLEPVQPGLCCQQVTCPFGVIVNIPREYKRQYPSSAAHRYNYV